ncbi:MULTISPECIES: hypothetical protein [Phyllobacteriaceae]|jgi:hypothetical protein|uniref:Uncharacterized protein n=1 Tax=Mesorhizobium hungaricum TaxID=1566387 RepID=A0A1C2DD44_9HYPH|nr:MULTISPECIES: hypothetical protein [Mesorhizobium]MBN9235099.1 hypothetical protein [Mesorhizobium sp.]OCX12701.1 hypothetical protein QV13_24190 [Mesorhizobium hungaricum]
MPNLTPAQQIADLDAALARRGTSIQLRKTNSATGQVTVPAKWRGYLPQEVIGIIQAGDTKVIVSPTGLEAFGIPPQNGFAVLAGIPRRIIAPTPIYDGGVLVRIELAVRG